MAQLCSCLLVLIYKCYVLHKFYIHVQISEKPPTVKLKARCFYCEIMKNQHTKPTAKPVIEIQNKNRGQTEWGNLFPDCKGRSQSPVDLPVKGFIRARGARPLMFNNYDIVAQKLTVHNDGRRVILYGQWNEKQKPVVYGGAAHSRRYIFHSLSLIWPSEHTIGGLQFPMETQMLHISADYNSLKEALDAAPSDPQAFLGIVNLYKYSDHTQQGLKEILDEVLKVNTINASVNTHPLRFFSPPFKEYACYQGSLTTPPCTESVLWLVRARSLPVTKEAVESAHGLLDPYGQPRRFAVRMSQPLNDRKVFLFY
ncbi:unnamed protein product [Parnassius apollo]|uniref:(apollo) hypothetical protein n=1 Tax=Parnassius apollo TaxID=110799 RepID=A0A8S3XU79_PARAO|nr:unnamed protein product [Parnassius apollo]